MPFSVRPYRRFPVHSAVTYNAGPFQGPRHDLESLQCRLALLG
jgi:hypothetical protein